MPLQRNSKVKMDISSCLTFDLRLTLIYKVYKVLTLVMPICKYQVSTVKETGVTFSMIESNIKKPGPNSLKFLLLGTLKSPSNSYVSVPCL